MFTLVQRRVFIDLIKTTALCLTGVSCLLVLVVAMIQISRSGLEPRAVLYIIPFLLPPLLTYTIPTCLLFACTVVYGGMNRSNEVLALKASGVHVFRIVWPILVLAILLGSCGVYLADAVIPACNRSLRHAIVSDLQGTLYAYLRQKGQLVDDKCEYEIYVRAVDGDQLHDTIIKHRTPAGGYDMIAQASKATLEVISLEASEPKVLVRLVDGIVVTDVENAVHFRDRQEEMPLPDIFEAPQGLIEGLSFVGCWDKAHDYNDKADRLAYLRQNGKNEHGNPASDDELYWLEHNQKRFERKARELNTEVHIRIAQASATIPFVLLGCPVSLLFRRDDFLQTFFYCYLPIIMVFYPAMILVFNVVKEGQITHSALVWVPTCALTLLSWPLLARVIKH